MSLNAIDSPAMVQTSFAATLLEPQMPCPQYLRAWNGSDPTARLAVYRNNVVSGLIDALAESFPVTQTLVGVEFFRAMASVFVRRHPPPTPILAHYGSRFPAFIDMFEPAQTVPYLADVARLEVARVYAYHAADRELVAPESVQAALGNAECLENLCFELHPSVSLLESPFAMVSVWSAHQGGGEIDLSNVNVEVPEDAMILRQCLDVVVIALPPGVAKFAAALRNGARLGDCAAASMGRVPDFDLSGALSILFHHGAVAAIVLANESPT